MNLVSLIHLIFGHSPASVLAGTLKGWAFIFLTALFLYTLINKAIRLVKRSETRLQEHLLTLEEAQEELSATKETLQAQLLRVRAREARFRRIFQGVSSGVMILHPAGTVTEANEAAQSLLGLSLSQLTGAEPFWPDWQARCENGLPFTWQNIAASLSPKQPAVLAVPFGSPVTLAAAANPPANLSGRVRISSARFPARWLAYTIHPICQPGSAAPEEIVLTLEDVTRQKNLEEQEARIMAELEHSQERYREILEHMSNAAVVFEIQENGQQFIIREFNRRAEILEQVNRQDVLGRSLTEVFPYAEQSGICTVLRRVRKTGHPEQFPAIYYPNGQDRRWRENYVYRLSTAEIVCLYRDVTARKQAEEELWQEKERAQITLHSIGDGVITTDVHGTVEYLNPIAEELTGWSLAEAKGKRFDEVFHIVSEIDAKEVENPIARCLKERRIVGLANHTVLIHRHNHPFAIEDSAAPVLDRQGNLIGAVLVFHDVSDKRALLRQMTHQAHHDALTGLPNRLLFNDRLRQAIAQARRKNHHIAILFLDIDRFKLVNDTLGHAVGDHLLRSIAARLKGLLRESDTVGRQGGDEFILILPEIFGRTEAGTVAQKILTVFSTPFLLEQEEVFITPSIGISLYPDDGTDTETLVRHADAAMYSAKELGRNNYQFFTPAQNETAQSRLEIENSLRRALANNELVIHYQPVISVLSRAVVGVEALVRWQHPHKGLLLPSSFISVAEDTGLIIPLGEWVLRSACNQVHAWHKSGYPLRVAVNLSARQFKQPQLAETIRAVLKETSLKPDSLELEITESIAADDLDLTITILRSLKDMGIRISIDDFGTGFSSLSYLRRFPIDTLKIDKSFVADILPRQGEEIVTAIIDLAQTLKLKVIAEGVETPAQLDFLAAKHCDEIQGYLFSKPLPHEEIGQFLAHRFEQKT
ncbi:cyclic di-GMP phosphodiesterase Gmr [Peptococcaceae bacterium CEB3]|nr:cyclic di-GMP phosphodiesterase Gmr [Peptococcaceae bacterium CEB3]